MLFNIDKNKSLSILQIAVAFFIIAAPAFLGLLPSDVCTYTLFLFCGLLTMMRIKKTRQMYISVYHIISLVMVICSLLSLFWITNRSIHFTYITLIVSGAMFFSLVVDYFSESSEERVHRRMMYMLSISGVLCAFINIIYWLTYIVPFAREESFSKGLGSNDFLAVFMLLCMFCAGGLIKGNSRFRKNLFCLAIAVMMFVFFMAKSLVAWIFAVMLCVIFVSTRRSGKMFFILSLSCVAVFAAAVLFIGNTTLYGDMFKDVFSYGLKHIFGKGGGFFSAKEIFMTQTYPEGATVGLFPAMCASSGVVGILCCAAVLFRAVMQFVKLRSWESLISLFLGVMIMLLPFGECHIPVFLWIGLIAYNEKKAQLAFKVSVKDKLVEKLLYAGAVLCVLATVLGVQSMMRVTASGKLENKDYMGAYRLYRAASAINIADAESCYGAAQALYESGDIKEYYSDAISLAGEAMERDTDNLIYQQLKAEIYYACENYELGVQEYTVMAARATVKDKYYLSMAEGLYKIVEASPKGSSQTKQAYDKMIEIAKQTRDRNYRKEINDIADKALVYTKGELIVENEY